MGRLQDLICKSKKHIGIDPASIFSKELLYTADFILYQLKDELYIAKSRVGKKGPSELAEVIDTIINIYFSSDMKKTLTPFTLFNASIKQELEKAIKEILIKHKVKLNY